MPQIITKRGYDFYECASALQKGIRRNDLKIAGYFGLELFMSGYKKYVWKRLLTVSAEDCDGIITTEIHNLYKSWQMINEGKKEKNKGRIFVSKAILILCKWYKNRDADHLQCLVYDKKKGITDEEIHTYVKKLDAVKSCYIPPYSYDVHTRKGKQMGKTKEDFFKSEKDCLTPIMQTNLFDDLI